ncbi:MAG: hypothetical protein OXT67_10815 [Zetaproteobacteria bacterium]|nr:hypothetical protein [Zetaproteobacteria bacterium]
MEMGKALLIPFTLSWIFSAHNCLAEDLLLPAKVKRQKIKSIQSSKKIQRKKRPLPESADPKHSEKKRRQEEQQKINALAWDPRPLRWSVSTNLVLTQTSASNRRSGYSTDPGLHLAAVKIEPSGSLLGIRILPMAGYGVHKKVSGRFAFNYIGVDWGYLWLSDLPQDRKKWRADHPELQNPERDAMMIRAGIAAGAKIGYVEAGINPASTDFETSRGLFPAPAVWMELRRSRLFFQRLGIDTSLGIMMTGEINWLWVSIGLSMWGV